MKYSTAGLRLPTLCPSHKLNRLLSVALRLTPSTLSTTISSSPWGADCFSLAYSPLFNASTAAEQQQILQLASHTLLSEAYAFKKAGMGYMAKMSLLAETTEERMLYALFGTDEATHLAQLWSFISGMSLAQDYETNADDPFLQRLETLLETTDRLALMFVVQGVLKGWGLSHCRMLSKTCQQTALGKLFRSFVQAETRHHNAGIALLGTTQLSTASRALIVETLADFLRIVQMGPQRLGRAITQVKGAMTKAQRIQLFTELDTETYSEIRLKLLRSLITQLAPDITDELEARHLFAPLPPARCA